MEKIKNMALKAGLPKVMGAIAVFAFLVAIYLLATSSAVGAYVVMAIAVMANAFLTFWLLPSAASKVEKSTIMVVLIFTIAMLGILIYLSLLPDSAF